MKREGSAKAKETVGLGVHVRVVDRAAIKQLAADSGMTTHRWLRLAVENAVKRKMRFTQETHVRVVEAECS